MAYNKLLEGDDHKIATKLRKKHSLLRKYGWQFIANPQKTVY